MWYAEKDLEWKIELFRVEQGKRELIKNIKYWVCFRKCWVCLITEMQHVYHDEYDDFNFLQ